MPLPPTCPSLWPSQPYCPQQECGPQQFPLGVWGLGKGEVQRTQETLGPEEVNNRRQPWEQPF